MASHLDRLNPEQFAAITHGDGPLLIFAGAGSGKTRVLTCRIAHLLLEHQVHPEEVFAVTFTNKAAGEMKRRVHELTGAMMSRGWVSTFHSSSVRILRRHAELLDFTPQFAIYDRNDSLSLMKKVLKRLKMDPKEVDPRTVLQQIDRAKNSYAMPDDIANHPAFNFSWREQFIELYGEYQRELQSANAMDFGDLLCNTITLLTLEPKILASYQRQFRYILVDEYQDTNAVQYMLIRRLSAQHRNLCVVGDDDQSIYAFRGASVENILSFKKDFPDAVVVTLSENYRSTKRIITAANSVIAKNKQRQEKQMRTTNDDGPPIVFHTADDEQGEASAILHEIRQLLGEGLSLGDIGILYRTNAQSRAIEEALVREGLPYQIFGGLRFYDRKEIKDILCYLRLCVNKKDNEAFLRVINTPTRGLGAQAVARIIQVAQSNRSSLYEALAAIVGSKQASAAVHKRYSAFVECIEELSALATQTATECVNGNVDSLGIFIARIADRSGYLQALRDEENSEADSRIENIEELSRVAIEYVRASREEGLEFDFFAFLDRASLASDLDKEANADGNISLMTLHLAKGLEFDAVFLPGLEEGLLPHVRSLDDRSGIEEERRLLYVGITRARKFLFLSYVLNRQSFGQANRFSGGLSRFFKDIPPELLERRGLTSWAANW